MENLVDADQSLDMKVFRGRGRMPLTVQLLVCPKRTPLIWGVNSNSRRVVPVVNNKPACGNGLSGT